jgi:hypothetical protein
VKIEDVIILKEAVNDLNDGKAFYDQIQEQIGNYFLDSLISDIESLIIYAGVHHRKYSLYRMLAHRFPYAIYYDIDDEVARVIAVLPMRRDPLWIRKKLIDRN